MGPGRVFFPALGLVLMLPIACGRTPPATGESAADGAAAAAPAGASSTNGPVHVDFSNAHLRVAPGVVLEVRQLRGELRSRAPDEPPVFDDPRSFVLHVTHGEVAMTPESLSNLLNDRVFAYPGAPLSDIEVSIEDGRLKQKGTLHKGIPLPFSTDAEVSVTEDGRVRLHPKSIKAIGLPVAGLMKLIHLELDDLVDAEGAPAIAIQDNDFILDAERLLDAPQIRGRLTAIRLEAGRIVQVFGKGALAAEPPADGAQRNYMYFRGNTLRFGKLTMHDTDMQLIDDDPSDPFDFYPDRYVVQLTAGYSKNRADGALRVFMPDFGAVR